MKKASFFIWDYTFCDDRIEITRNFFLTRESVIYIDKIEMAVLETDIIFKRFGRCNLLLTFAGNIFTLFGLPTEVAEAFCEQVCCKQPTVHPSLPANEQQARRVTLSTADLLKKSLLQTKLGWYLLLVAALWVAVFLMGSELITSDRAHAIASFVFRHMITAGTLVLSLGLPTMLIWIWAFTGGFLVEFLKYYRYTATRTGNVLCFEYGLIIHRRVYIAAERIAITEFKQTPVMRICGYGRLDVRAVGYHPYFLKSQPVLPFLKCKQLSDALDLLIPEIEQPHHERIPCSLRYGFITRKWVLPLLCLALLPIWGFAWVIVALLVAVVVICSILLEYRNTDLALQNNTIYLSSGGFYRRAAWIRPERIELVAVSASRRKKGKGFVDLQLKVFGKRGRFARLRNIDSSCALPFGFGSPIK